MSSEFSWNIIESTFDKVSDVLGESISEELMQGINDNPVLTENCEFPGDEQKIDCRTDGNILPLTQIWLTSSDELVPQERLRSNSWPRRKFGPSLNLLDPVQQSNLPLVSEEESQEEETGNPSWRAVCLPKKSSRRNPWGNCSYSDIIVQAITCSPDKRLTLNQIYDWMITSIPYFRDRQDNASSAGWKNSIRHNLSLHQKFVKVSNEDPGKSSWWTINPETKQGNKPRRRSTYGDSKSFQIKREKARKRAELAKNSGRLERSSSTNWLTLSPPPSLEPYRARSNSSASSCDEMSLSSFRSRSFSNSSTNSQTSPSHFPEPLIPSFNQILGSENVATDLDDIRLDDLNLDQGENTVDPAEIIREYLHPTDNEAVNGIFANRNLTILEPRNCDTVGTSVIKFASSDSTVSAVSEAFCQPFIEQNMNQNHDEDRKVMIKDKLNSLIKKRLEINENQSTLSVDNRKNLDSALMMKIKLLQEQVDKFEGEQTLKNDNHDMLDNGYESGEVAFMEVNADQSFM